MKNLFELENAIEDIEREDDLEKVIKKIEQMRKVIKIKDYLYKKENTNKPTDKFIFMDKVKEVIRTTERIIGTLIDWNGDDFKNIDLNSAKTNGSRINKTDLVNLFNLSINNGEKVGNNEILFMNMVDYNCILMWDCNEFYIDKSLKNELRLRKLLGRFVFLTTDKSVIKEGHIYLFKNIDVFFNLVFSMPIEKDILEKSICVLDLNNYQKAISDTNDSKIKISKIIEGL